MFYEGTLQEGISTAVGQQKLVFCFVTDDNAESETWEKEFLQDSSLKDVIAKQAVALRLTAGSEEAGYLAQIFPLPKTPTIVIMKHGELKEYIAAGVGKQDFFRRIQTSFNVSPPLAGPSLPEASSSSPPRAPSLAGVPSTVEQSENVRRVLEDRAARQQAAKKEADKEAEKQAQQDAAQEKKKAAAAKDEAGADAPQQAELLKKKQQAELLKKKKQQDSDERQRILRRIQADKEDRRHQAQEREQRKRHSQSSNGQSSSAALTPSPSTSASSRSGEFTSVQVRLFDGSTIRSRFKTSSPVRHIRNWVDESRTDGRLPYAFKQLLTPLPNRPIDDTEEGKSLGDMCLSPSSTLVLVPIPRYASAYDEAVPGIRDRLVGFVLAIFAWLLGLVGLGEASRSNQLPPTAQQAAANSGSASNQAKKHRRQGLGNPSDPQRDPQLYNGNSLNFEPRPDEEEL
ncbi:uncharacterized protein UV8b_04094 [Ustilaginoidea virens]|uniref:UBX domain-containing protein 2 n=1 Tax=Ustilaginoidea virens TaxID=1159556 RepID=A0A8E5HR44_USTVR|nr:uncharacterized protein UV8b_04094 [Ustilaginoidea virens]QUC19853.1 hypothetical protein UV8b_04094 [Ustilaginoidea virens]